MEKNDVWSAALAGLLHDIGKFALRAGASSSRAWDAAAKQEFGYRHALLTGEFIERHLPAAWREHVRAAAYHHRPRSKGDCWVQLADHLASSEQVEDEDKPLPQIRSIVSALGGHTSAGYLPIKRLNPQDAASLFPVPRQQSSAVDADFRQLWDEFTKACQQTLVTAEAVQVYLEKIYALLQEFTWCVSAGFSEDASDVSLFDHARSTSALAACLAYDNRSEDWCQSACRSPIEVCYLVGGDLSGVQNFIYTITSSGAAKSLRARSFYVQLISEALALALVRRLELPITNLLYVGGGGFQLLVPVKTVGRLPEIARDLTDRLLEVHRGALGLTLKWTAVFSNEFDSFNQVRDRLGREINIAKRQPFSAASPQILAKSIGVPITQGGDPLKFCRVTGEDGENIIADEDGYKSRFVISLEKLGRQLPSASYLVLSETEFEPPVPAKSWNEALRSFGLDVKVASAAEHLRDLLTNLPEGLHRVWRLDPIPGEGEAPFHSKPEKTAIFSYKPFARLTPLNEDGIPKTTEELAAHPRRGHFERWGVLRMDLDNMGELFQKGLGDRVSLSRVASLSFSLRLFFEGWLPELAKPDLEPYLYLQYAGGDDLFIIGAWDALPEFALRVRDSLEKFACGNPAISISGGMCIVEAAFPLYQAAREAGEAEDKAKAPRSDGRSKNAFTFLDVPMDWETVRVLQAEAYRLAEGVNRGCLPNSLLQVLQSLAQQFSSSIKRQKNGREVPVIGPWTWMAAYQLTRMASGIKDPGYESFVLELRDRFLSPNKQTRFVGLAARWAQYLTRGGN